MRVKVYVTLKEGILDPQGTAVKKALVNLNHKNIKELRIGKVIDIQIEGSDGIRVEAQLKEICDKVLSNPIIENYTYEFVN